MVDDEKNAILLGIGFMTVTLVLSGVVFPLQSMAIECILESFRSLSHFH